METKVKLVKVVTSSEIAALTSPPHSSSKENIIFGKIFEEEYTKATYLYEKLEFFGKEISKKYLRAVAWRLKNDGIYDKKLLIRAYRMYATLLGGGIAGRKPKTSFRKLSQETFVAAQPDLENLGKYYEFKTYHIDEYARSQSHVFSWVLREPIELVGMIEMGDGKFQLESEKIVATGLVLPDFSQRIGSEQEACKRCGYPLNGCKCEAGQRAWHNNSKDNVLEEEENYF